MLPVQSGVSIPLARLAGGLVTGRLVTGRLATGRLATSRTAGGAARGGAGRPGDLVRRNVRRVAGKHGPQIRPRGGRVRARDRSWARDWSRGRNGSCARNGSWGYGRARGRGRAWAWGWRSRVWSRETRAGQRGSHDRDGRRRSRTLRFVRRLPRGGLGEENNLGSVRRTQPEPRLAGDLDRVQHPAAATPGPVGTDVPHRPAIAGRFDHQMLPGHPAVDNHMVRIARPADDEPRLVRGDDGLAGLARHLQHCREHLLPLAMPTRPPPRSTVTVSEDCEPAYDDAWEEHHAARLSAQGDVIIRTG